MLAMIKDAIIINAYWFSLPLIGYAIFSFIKSFKKQSYFKNVSSAVLRQYPFTIFIASLALMVFLFAVLSVFLYAFHLPVIVPVVVYSLLLVLSVIYLLLCIAKRLFTTFDIDPFQLKGQTLLVKILFVVMFVMLIADFVLTVFVAKAFPWGDAVYHMSRVCDILAGGFNIQSSFFNNLPEGGYLYNVMYTLYAVPSLLFSLEPMKVWEYSLGFFRLSLWLSTFALSAHVFKRWLSTGKTWLLFSILSVISAVSIYNYQFFTANYPSKLVVVWLTLFVICLSYSSKKTLQLINPIIIALGFLIVTTHTIYALIAACFLMMLSVVKFLLIGKSYLTKPTVITTVTTLIILLTGPLITKLMPVKISSNLIDLVESSTTKVFNMQILSPAFPSDIFGWCIWIFGILTVFVTLNILRKNSSKSEMAVFATVSFFYPLIVYVPFVFSIFRRFIPVWVIQRFSAMDVLSFFNIIMGTYCLYFYVPKIATKYFKLKNIESFKKILILIIVAVMLCFSAYAAKPTYKLLIKDWRDKKNTYSETEQVTKAFKGILKDNKLVISTATHSYYLNSMFDIDILAVEYGHSPLASDGANRGLCQDYIMKNLNYNELKAVGANYLVISPWDDMKNVRLLADSKPYMKKVAGNQYYLIYEFIGKAPVNKTDGSVYKPCLDYQLKESL